MPTDPLNADFGWHYPPGVTAADIDREFGDEDADEEDDNECYPSECRRGRPCHRHYDG